jgi:hydroxybutyrate-dimer hydrolase
MGFRRAGGFAAASLILLGAVPAASAAAPKPAYVDGEVVVTHYPPGGNDDLLTAGLGAGGLRTPPVPGAPTPTVTDPQDPAQLRRLAIFNNYKALVDTTPTGGFGTLYGPTVDRPGEAGPDGQVYGWEYLAFARDGGGDRKVTVMVQIPSFFGKDRRPACVVTAPSSGSRGVYGAIGTAGEWGLKKGCAVAYTDKGTGIGAHDLQNDTVTLLRGQRVPEDEAGDRSNFTAGVSERERLAFAAAFPNRWAWKHAHSQDNPEKDWDEDVLRSIEFAFWALEDRFGGQFDAASTLVIGSSVSNGGGASLRAAEIASPAGLIDGAVVSEPNVTPRFDPRFGIRQPDGSVLHAHSRPLYDYLSVVDLYQGCANRPFLGAPGVPAISPLVVPVDAASADRRCESLREAGLLRRADPVEAQARINAHGLLAAQNVLAPSYWSFYVAQAVTLTYANAYARASVLDNLCGYSFAPASLAAPTPGPTPPTAPLLFGLGNGIPPTGGIAPVNNLSPGGPLYDPGSGSPSFQGRLDQNLEGAACLRSLWPLPPQARVGREASLRDRVRVLRGVGQILADGRLHGTPTIILHGRDDALIAPNHSSRAYYGLNLLNEGQDAPTRYYEVTNAQHFDAFLPLEGYSTRYLPLHHYFLEALDLMWAHLTAGQPLPASQVVRTTPRAAATETVTRESNVPDVAASPAAGDAITFERRVLSVPN